MKVSIYDEEILRVHKTTTLKVLYFMNADNADMASFLQRGKRAIADIESPKASSNKRKGCVSAMESPMKMSKHTSSPMKKTKD